MEYCAVFGSSMSQQHSCIGYEETPYGSATSHFVGGTGTTHVTPQVFAEMPTPSSWYGTDVLAPGFWNYCYVHQSPIQSEFEQGGSTNLKEQHLDGMPQSYGYHNLNRQSLFLADGTERHYYALAEDYPLEQATPPISPPAIEKVDVTAPLSVAAQAADLAPVLCSKGNITAGSATLLFHDVQRQTAVQDALNGLKEMPLYDVYEDVTACRSCLHPTVHTSAVDTEEEEISKRLPREVINLAKKMDLQQQTIDQIQGNLAKLTEMVARLGIAVNSTGSVQSVQQQQTQSSGLEFSTPPPVHQQLSPILDEEHQDSEQLVQCVGKAPEPEQTSAGLNYISDVLDFTLELQQQDDDRAGNYSVLKVSNSVVTRCNQLSTKHIKRELRLLWDPGASASLQSSKDSAIITLQQIHNKDIYSMGKFSLEKERQVQWDPGIKFIFVELWWLSIGTGYVLRHLLPMKFGANWAHISHSAIMCYLALGLEWTEVNAATVLVLLVPCSKGKFVPKHALRQMAAVLSCPLPSFGNRSKLQWDPGIATSSYMYSWLEMSTVKTLTWSQRPLISDLQCQLPISNTSCIWDTGFELLYLLCKRLNITALIQMKGWTSMTYSGISSSEYSYTMDFLTDQWEFIHQQGVQHNYNAKNLLSSQNYLQIWLMDIIFITFLPPWQEASLATVRCSKTNNIADSEPMLVHHLKLPTTVQDVSNVLKEMPVYDVYEDEQQEREQPPKCSSEPSKNPLPQVVSELAFPDNVKAYVSRYIKFRYGQCIQEIVGSDLPPGYAMGDVQHLKAYKCKNEEGREVWDPGASLPLMSSKTQHSSQALQPATHATILAASSVTRFSKYTCLSFWVQNNIFLLWKSEIGMTTYISWDPGILNMLDMILVNYAVPHQVKFVQQTTKLSLFSSEACIQYYAPNAVNSVLHNLAAWPTQSVGTGASYIWDPGTVLWYTFVWLVLGTVREHLYAYYLAARHSSGRSISYPGNIMCYITVSSVLEENEMLNGPHTRFWSSQLQPMQYNDYYQACSSLIFQQYSHHYITYREIALWLIHFQPP